MKTEEHEFLARVSPIVVGLGEVIWDLLPGGKQLGGAPSNFAYIARLLGHRSVVASRTGADEFGREACARLRHLEISTDYLQVDETHPTGTVGVEIDARGEPRYRVQEDVAWDYLEWTPSWEKLAAQADAVCFGTLAQRHPRAQATIIRFLEQTRRNALRIFDVNLRQSFFTAEMLHQSLGLATVVKLNIEELHTAAEMLGLKGRTAWSLGQRLIERYELALVAITRGAHGSLLITKEERFDHPGLPVKITDTIGAGDAFTAALAHCYLRNLPLKIISEAANRMGAWVASQPGATPEASAQALEQVFLGLDSVP